MDTKDFMGEESMPAVTPSSDEKTLAVLAHVLAIISCFIAPLIIYLLKKDESAYVAAHAKESLNFQITMFIIYAILFVSIIGILLIWLAQVINLVLVIIATIKANENKMYRYPFNLRLIK
jgi:uncharacterized protein